MSLFQKKPTCVTLTEIACHAPPSMGLRDLPDDPAIHKDLDENNGINCEGSLIPSIMCGGCRYAKIAWTEIEEDNRITEGP